MTKYMKFNDIQDEESQMNMGKNVIRIHEAKYQTQKIILKIQGKKVTTRTGGPPNGA